MPLCLGLPCLYTKQMDQNKGSDALDPTGYNTLLSDNTDARMVAARIILTPLFQAFAPTSVLDVGCGLGAWLHVAKQLGTDTVQGVDGPWIDTTMLAIPPEMFLAQNLDTALSLDRQFDLVISLEVAEHISAPAADIFIDNLVRHGDIVLFSAAIPFQGGHGHINEQWPSYWAEKFRTRGYQTLDAIRPMIWSDERVFWWLRQNTLLFMNDNAFERFSDFADETVDDLGALALVHPDLYMRWVAQSQR